MCYSLVLWVVLFDGRNFISKSSYIGVLCITPEAIINPVVVKRMSVLHKYRGLSSETKRKYHIVSLVVLAISLGLVFCISCFIICLFSQSKNCPLTQSINHNILPSSKLFTVVYISFVKF